ncbi:2-polyprenylphenol hydroxylase [Rhodomicrobium udaipurense JA643]|uniref:2-polyprenylphenol 6-hydroxylase n=1 Tax=Rhodomicrobium udaipurense TaxID=1202716 RepID=A0A8I1GI14_9HYPH|nr:2-polyprenylphenol 6-hydroxylase [Rhodomicrobium udaipurense]KAI94928.1 2-polyprenylphenol hydroxylase [Rhodomicrobium udaipurense JA643]MBJ7543950.1 2-polyprenylphenol 6-hydroxylase [Rhodomicrobium udaipurense]
MFKAIRNTYRLTKAGATLAWYGVGFVPDYVTLPAPLRILRADERETAAKRQARGERLAKAIRALGPTYIKLGQFLATRPDVVGPHLANALGSLRDRLPPFSVDKAHHEIEAAFNRRWQDVFVEFGPPLAAASIAQVHKAVVRTPGGNTRAVAVKILRPDIEKRFERDLESFYFAAHTAERVSQPMRRLRPVAAVDTLAQSVVLEMDLRLEAAAISEMADNIAKSGDVGFRVPRVDWERTSKRVLTLDWIDGIPLTDIEAVRAAGVDMEALGLTVIQSFLKHAIRDGFFHADMHQGNLFVDPRDGALIAVDFGIMGRLGPKEQRFLAEILYGFITRNYYRASEIHFEAGYVPANQSVAAFGQALRAIGEPIMGRPSEEISMARLLTQLFENTEVFQMKMRPELLLLQKTMVVVEGVARSLDPKLNIWVAAEPVVREWLTGQLGPRAQIRDAVSNVGALAVALKQAPDLIERGAKIVDALDPDKPRETSPQPSRWPIALPLWLATGALLAIAAKLLFP